MASDRRLLGRRVLRYALCLMADRPSRARAQRRADRALIAAYHEAQLANLLERVRAGFAAYDAGQLDAFGLDDIIHRYKRSEQALELLRRDGRSGGDGGPHPGVAESRGKRAGLVGRG